MCLKCSASALAWHWRVFPVVLTRGRLCVCCPLSLLTCVQTLCVTVYEFIDEKKALQLSLFAPRHAHFPSAFARLKVTRLLDVGYRQRNLTLCSGPLVLACTPCFTRASLHCEGTGSLENGLSGGIEVVCH